MSSCEVKDGPATDMVVRGFLDGSVVGEEGRLAGVVIEMGVGRKSRRVDATGEGEKLDLSRYIEMGLPDALLQGHILLFGPCSSCCFLS